MSHIDNGVRFEEGPTILLNSGHYFDLGNPEGSTFAPYDLILGMARECRFAGQCEPRYCVAEHSAHLASYVAKTEQDPMLAWAALWHDSPEGIIKDIPRPQKLLLPDYKALERRVEPAILSRLLVPCPLPDLIKRLDMAAQLCEKSQIEPHRTHWPRDRDPERLFDIVGAGEELAIKFFLRVALLIADAVGIAFDPYKPLEPGHQLGRIG